MHAMTGHSLTTLSDSYPHRWFLPQTVFVIRVHQHVVTKQSPFYLLYGVEPRLPGNSTSPRETVEPTHADEEHQIRHETTVR